MIYTWQCEAGHETEVERTVAQIDEAPAACCEMTCKAAPNKRIIKWSKPQSQLVHGGKVGWHAEEYTPTRSIK